VEAGFGKVVRPAENRKSTEYGCINQRTLRR